MVRAIEARVEELEAAVIDEEYEKDWIYPQHRMPGQINKAVA